MRKSYYQQLLMVAVKKVLNYFGFRSIRNVVFFAPVDFHLQHLMPVVDMLRHDKGINVFVVKTPGFIEGASLENVVFLERETFERMYWKIYDVVVTTELDLIPYWFGVGKRIGMFHGAGPKKGYLERMTGKEFDYIFSPGPFVHQQELTILGRLKGAKTEVIPVGLPSTDILVKTLGNRCKKVTKKKPIVLYAPTWHWDQNMVSIDEEILKNLSLLDMVHVIVKPHPNLLNPNRNDNVDWESIIRKYESDNFVLSKNEPINDLLIDTDIIVGDISSVMYEFLIFDKPGILYIKEEILEKVIYSEAIEPLTNAYELIDDACSLESALSNALSGVDIRQGCRQRLKESTFYNIGFSASIAAEEIVKIAKI